ncbi:MAG TPA: TolC family protein [Gemmatimonadaceae bacterium]|jgi:outer membrane protein
MKHLEATLLLVPSLLVAQVPTPAPQRITFAEAIQIALKQNLTVRQIENNLDVQQATAKQAFKNLLPSFGVGMSASENVGQQFNLNTGKLTTQTTKSLSPGVSSNVLLFDGGRSYSNVASARRNADALEMDVSRARQTAVFTVATNFVTLVGAQSQLDVQRQNLAAVKAQLEQIELYVEAGGRPVTDAYAQRSLAAAAELGVAQAELAVENARIDLISALQLDPSRQYEFIPPSIADVPVIESFPLDSLVAVANAHRPDVAAARDRLLAARQDSRGARMSRLPTISANLNYGTAWTSASDSSIGYQFNQRRGGGVGLNFSLPIFDRGQVTLNEARTEVAEENAQLALQNQQRVAALEVRRSWATLHSAQQQLAAATAQEKSASLAIEGVQQRYRAGAAAQYEIAQAQSQLVTAQSALASARYNLILARTLLSYYTGTLDPSAIRLQ